MKIFFLLIILGFSQVLGKNYGSLTESKLKREDQLDNKIEVVNNILADLEDAPLDFEEFCDDSCFSDEDCEQCSNCSNGAYCDIRDPGFSIGFRSFPCECFDDDYEYDNSMDYFNAKSDEVQSENEDKIIELEEMVSNNLVDSEAASSELSQPKTECDKWETSCSSNEDCKQCSDCPNGAYCIPHINDAGTKIYPSCECYYDYYEYDNSMDDFNAKSDEVLQSENEDKVIELEEMVRNNLVDSEAALSELSQPKTECDKWGTSCSSHDDCKQCSDQCPTGAVCIMDSQILGSFCECVDDHYTDPDYYEYDNGLDYFN